MVRLRRLLVVAFVAFVVLGLHDGLLGTAWPSIQSEFSRPVDDLGVLVAALVVGYGTSSWVSGGLSRRWGTGTMLVAAFAIFSAAGLVYATAPVWPVVVVASVGVGVAKGLLDPVVNAHVARHHGTRSMSALHLTFGLGATLGPLVMVRSIHVTGTWRWGLGVAVIASLAMLAVMVATRRSWGVAVPAATNGSAAARFGDAWRVLLVFSTSTGVEVGAGAWAFTLLVSRGVTEGVAAGFVSAYWGGLTLGRLLGTIAGDAVTRRTLYAISAGLLFAGIGLLWSDPAGVGAWGLPVAGLGISLVFPVTVLETESRMRDQADIVMGWGFAAGGAGAAFFPWLVGFVAARTSLEWIPGMLLGVVAALTFAIAGLLRYRPAASVHSPDGRALH